MKVNDIKLGVLVCKCSECDKYVANMKLTEMFQTEYTSATSMFSFDESTSEIIVFEDDLIKAMQMIVPHQKPHPIRIEKGSGQSWRMKRVQEYELSNKEA